MPTKPKTSKAKPKQPAKNSSAKPVAKKRPAPKRPATSEKTTYCVAQAGWDLEILSGKVAGQQATELATFEEARHFAIDRLVEAIERLEHRLDHVKRSRSFEQYQALQGE
jgi:hypothetical protein